MSTRPPVIPDLQSLATLFCRSLDDLGHCQEVTADQLPDSYRRLLDHHGHMTVAWESALGGPVAVEVKKRRLTRTHYERKSLLRDPRGGPILQYCVVRLRFAYLDETVREDIELEQIPLGRILIRHNVLRAIERFSLWRITTGPELRSAFGIDQPRITYGRTALIYCNGDPAVELLEIIAPR